jgi:hypothetical protein
MAETLENIDAVETGGDDQLPPFLRKQVPVSRGGGVVPPFLQKKEPQTTQTTAPKYEAPTGPIGSVIPAYAPANRKAGTDIKGGQFNIEPAYTETKQIGPVITTYTPTVAEFHQEEVGKANTRIQKELSQTDPAIRQIIRDNKLQDQMAQFNNQLKGRGIDATANPDLLNRAAHLIPKANMQVNDNEVKDYKQAMLSNVDLARQALHRQAELHPEKSKQLAADIYLLDSQNRSGGTNTDVILKNAEGIKKGELDYSIKNGGQVIKPLGIVGAMGNGFKDREDQFQDYHFLANSENQDIIAEYEKRRNTPKNPDEPLPVPKGMMGKFGGMVGSEGITMVKGAIPSLLAAGTGGAAEVAAPWMGALLTSPDFYQRGYANSFAQNYNDLRDHGKSPEEALQIAKDRAAFDAREDVAVGAVMTAVGGKLGLKTANAKFSPGFLGAVKGVGKQLVASGPEAGALGLTGALGQVQKNLHSDKPGEEGVIEAALTPIALHYGIGVIAAGAKLAHPDLYKSAVDNMAKQPEELVNKAIGEKVESGEITPQQANDAHLIIEDKRSQHEELLNKAKEIVAKGKMASKEAEPIQHAAQNDPEVFQNKLQDIAEKAHQGESEQLTERYGEDLINVAKQLFPKEPLKLKIKPNETDNTTQTGDQTEKVDNAAPQEPAPISNQQKEAAAGFLKQGIENGTIDKEYAGMEQHPEHVLTFIREGLGAGKEADLEKEFGKYLIQLAKAETSYPIVKNVKLKDNAIQQPSAEGEIPHSAGAGENIPEGGTGMGSSEQGNEATGAQQEGQNQGQKEKLDAYGLPFEDEPGDKRSGIKNAISNPTRFERGLPKVDIPKLGSDNEVLQQGKELVDSGKINPREVVQRINSTNEGMHPDEAKAMQYYMHQLNTHENNLREGLAHAENPTQQSEINSHLQQLSDEIDAATEANLKSGAAWAHVGNIRQIVTDAGFNPSRERAIIKDAYGGKIPEEVQKKIDAAIKERDEAIAERLKAEERLKNSAAEKTLQKVKDVVEKEEKKTGKQKKEQIREERKSILDELKAAIKKDTSTGYAVPFPTHTIPVIGKLAISYFKEGYVNLDELVSKVFDDIKAHFPNATKKDVRDAISQYDPLRDYAKETSTEKLQNKEARIEKKLATGDILDKKTTPSLNFEKDSEWMKASQKALNAEYKLKQAKKTAFESKKNMYEKGLMWAGRAFRLSVLSGYNVLGKLASAATIGGAAKRIPEQAIGRFYSGIFKGIAEKAPIEGMPNIAAEAKFYKEFFDPVKFGKNAVEILKTGASPLSKKFSGAEYEHIPLLYLPTDLHQIIKDPLKRGTFEASFKNGLAWAQKNGIDIHDPLVVQALETAAYKRAQYEIFQEQNALTKAFGKWKANMEKNGNVGATGKFLADFLIPVSTVPTNIAKRLASTSPLGLIRGGAKVIQAYRNGIENLSNEEADAVMRQLKQGSLGTALWLTGWFASSHFGGLYSKFNPDKKRKEGDFVSNEMEINGKMIPKPVQHALPLEIMQLAATMRRIHDNYVDKKDENQVTATTKAALGAIGATIEQIPILETGAHLYGSFNNPYEANKLKEDAERRFEPQILKETGIIPTDKPKTASSAAKKRGPKREKRR